MIYCVHSYMKKVLALALFTGSLLLSQTPDITGVWRADLQKSKRMGPPVVTYLVIIGQKNESFQSPHERGSAARHGNHRDLGPA